MIEHRPFSRLGRSESAGRTSAHHFCFAAYQHVDRMNWGRLRVVNHSHFAPGAATAPMPQHDMEMLTYVRAGSLVHRGHFEGRRTGCGEIQLVSPGGGVLYADTNPSTLPAEAVEIWIVADAAGDTPARRVTRMPKRDSGGSLPIIASGRRLCPGVLRLRADAEMCGATLEVGDALAHPIDATRCYYLLAIDGCAEVNGLALTPGDGTAIAGEDLLNIVAKDRVDVILIDVAATAPPG